MATTKPINIASDQVRRVVAERAATITQTVDPDVGEPVGAMYQRLMLDTWERTLHPGPDGVFVTTGDIPAMWLRDSSAQMRPWLELAARSDEVAQVLAGVALMHWRMIRHDPYANAFTRGPGGHSIHLGDVHMLARAVRRGGRDGWIWERKYELDSLGLPILFAEQLRAATGDTGHLTWSAHAGIRDIVALWRREQYHHLSNYRFLRIDAMARGRWHDTLVRRGRGTPVGVTGMTWQGFRPSDDACALGYNIPAQFLAVKALRCAAAWCDELWHDADLAADCRALALDIRRGIDTFATLPDGSWAYEVDGLGTMLLADDANMPSLLSLPLLGDVAADDPGYLATRERILSPRNPWWHEGSAARGISSPHTPGRRVWPIALAVEGLTTPDRAERVRLARLLARTTAGTGAMHESFCVDDPSDFTRGWFSWADMMFCELVSALVPSDQEHR